MKTGLTHSCRELKSLIVLSPSCLFSLSVSLSPLRASCHVPLPVSTFPSLSVFFSPFPSATPHHGDLRVRDQSRDLSDSCSKDDDDDDVLMFNFDTALC